MTNNTLKIFILTLTLITTSCKKELKTIIENDYKVVEVDYGFDNYMKNIRDKSEQYIIKERNIVEINVGIDGRATIENNVVGDSLIVTELKKHISQVQKTMKCQSRLKKNFNTLVKLI